MPVRLRHVVMDAHDLPGVARFWTQAPGWQVLSGRENEIVIGTGQNAPAGLCFHAGHRSHDGQEPRAS
jgi:catechol-2,3-dioxygenase